MNVKWVSHHHWPINPLQNRAPMPTNRGNEPPPYQGSVDKRGMTALLREPGNEFPGSVDQSRLKPTLNALSESPSGDFSSTQPGNSFPGVGPARASARKSTVPVRRGTLLRAAQWTAAARFIGSLSKGAKTLFQKLLNR